MKVTALAAAVALLLPWPAAAQKDPCGRFPDMQLYGFNTQAELPPDDPRAEAWREDIKAYWQCRRGLGTSKAPPSAAAPAAAVKAATIAPGPCPSIADIHAVSQGVPLSRRCPGGVVFEMRRGW